jgi:hypothetical protein
LKRREFGKVLTPLCDRLVYFFVYTARVKGMTFGFGPLFRVIGKGVGAVKGLFKRSPKAEQQPSA